MLACCYCLLLLPAATPYPSSCARTALPRSERSAEVPNYSRRDVLVQAAQE